MGYGVLTGVEQESWKMIQVMVNQLGDYKYNCLLSFLRLSIH